MAWLGISSGGTSIKNFSDKWVWLLAKCLIYSPIFVIFMSLHENFRQEMRISDRRSRAEEIAPPVLYSYATAIHMWNELVENFNMWNLGVWNMYFVYKTQDSPMKLISHMKFLFHIRNWNNSHVKYYSIRMWNGTRSSCKGYRWWRHFRHCVETLD